MKGVCGKEETIIHALFEFKCTWARLFWKEMKAISQVNIPVLHPQTWASDLVQGKLGSDQFACMRFIMGVAAGRPGRRGMLQHMAKTVHQFKPLLDGP